MKMISCHKQLSADQLQLQAIDNLKLGGVGQGGGTYWQDIVGIKLQQAIAGPENTFLCPRSHGQDSFDRTDYDIPNFSYDLYDLAYCQLFEVPKKRPAKIVYSIISDYIDLEDVLEDFLTRAKPNFLIAFQYPKSDLDEQCKRHNCKLYRLPWFNAKNVECVDTPVKTMTAMCTGKIGRSYPMRQAIFDFLKGFKEKTGRADILLSAIGGRDGAMKFSLNYDDYEYMLGRTKYCFSGGIYDYQIPPKYFEICNHGGTLVCPDMPLMKDAGFIDGETYIKLDLVEQIPGILESDAWRKIGPAGQKMVHERHSITQRAKEILEIYNELAR